MQIEIKIRREAGNKKHGETLVCEWEIEHKGTAQKFSEQVSGPFNVERLQSLLNKAQGRIIAGFILAKDRKKTEKAPQ